MININSFIESQLARIEEEYNNGTEPLILKGMLSTLTNLIEETNLMEKYFKDYIELENKINTLYSRKSA